MIYVAASCGVSARAQRPPSGGRDEETFRFRFVGPRVGNRIASVSGVPGAPSTYYAGAASGGVWKSTDGGNRWDPIFDKQAVAAIGAIAVAPSDPSVIWVGKGEAWAIRDSDVMGNGVYLSTDSGNNWTHVGLDETGHRPAAGARSLSHHRPGAALGVLFANANTGCSGLAMDPRNPRILLAGMWQVEMHTWGELSGGPGSAIYISRDGGAKWSKLEGHGLPKPPLGKIDVAIAPTNSERYFALTQTKDQGALWRSEHRPSSGNLVRTDRRGSAGAATYLTIEKSAKPTRTAVAARSGRPG